MTGTTTKRVAPVDDIVVTKRVAAPVDDIVATKRVVTAGPVTGANTRIFGEIFGGYVSLAPAADKDDIWGGIFGGVGTASGASPSESTTKRVTETPQYA